MNGIPSLVAVLTLTALSLTLRSGEDVPRSAPGPSDAERSGAVLHVASQSHIDIAWLWRYDPETIEDCAYVTFLRALDNLERFPDYFFTASQVPLYEPMADRHPEILARIRKRVQEGRWEVAGGHFVEFEGAGPSGESLVRQCLYGQRAWRKLFGIEVTTAWQEDAWTHPATLPQILAKSGMKSYMFKRGARGQNCFLWEGPDGSRVLAYHPVHTESVEKMADFVEEMQRTLRTRNVFARIGGGDHGGGPDAGSIARLREKWASSSTRFPSLAPDSSQCLSPPTRRASNGSLSDPRARGSQLRTCASRESMVGA